MNDGSPATILILLLPLALLGFLVFSQRRRARAMEDFQRSINVGDEIITMAGIYGKVVAADDAVVSLEIANGVVVRVDRRAIGMRQSSPDRPGR